MASKRYSYKVGFKFNTGPRKYRYYRTLNGVTKFATKLADNDKFRRAIAAKIGSPLYSYLVWGPIVTRQEIDPFQEVIYEYEPAPYVPPKPKPRKAVVVKKRKAKPMTASAVGGILKAHYKVGLEEIAPEPPPPVRIYFDADGKVCTQDEAVRHIDMEVTDANNNV